MDFSNVDLALGTLTAYDSGSSVSSGSLAYAVGTAVLSQSMDLTQQMGAKTGSGLHTILTYAYENAFITNNYGYSSAISIIIFLLLLAFSARYQLGGEGER